MKTESRAGGTSEFFGALKLTRTAATTRMVAVACTVAAVGLGGGETVANVAAAAAAISSMGMTANALAREW